MYSLFIRCEPGEEDLLSASLWDAQTLGIIEEPGGLRAFFDDAQTVDAISLHLPRGPHSVRQEADIDWAQTARDSFQPLLVGQRFFVVPEWRDDPTPPGRLRLEINPGMACGTGQHPCTRLCLAAMERYLQPGDFVLDVGTGSGILAHAAKLLGAARIFACDIDEEPVRIAAARLDAPFFIGSADAIRSYSIDLIVANISSCAAEQLREEFRRVSTKDARWILSGFEAGDTPGSYQPVDEIGEAEWRCQIIQAAHLE